MKVSNTMVLLNTLFTSFLPLNSLVIAVPPRRLLSGDSLKSRFNVDSDDYFNNPLPLVRIASIVESGHTARTENQWYKPRGRDTWVKLEKHIVISRDCGRAGMMADRRFWMFCDSEVQQVSYEDSYKTGEDAVGVKPNLVAFVGNSFAYDNSRELPSLENPIRLAETGMWDESGRIVNWIGLTQEEKDYNSDQQKQSNQGALTKGRNAVWIDSPICQTAPNQGLLYAPVVNVEVTKGRAHQFKYLGTTLVNVTFVDHFLEAPVATRVVPYLFGPDDINFGTLFSGYWGGNFVYVFGTTKIDGSDSGGIVVARVQRGSEEFKDRYQYWDGYQWTATPLQKDRAPEAAIIISGVFSRPTIVFSQLHGSFLIIYTKGNLESVFYIRKLNALEPLSIPTDDLPLSSYLWDYFPEQLVKFPWTAEEMFYKAAPATAGSFSFAGSVALGYLGGDDIKNGGDKLMLTWTSKTQKRAWMGPNGEYEAGTAIVTFENFSIRK